VQYFPDMAEAEIEENGSELLSESERRAIISRIHSLLYWVGMFIPQVEIVDGKQVDLRDVVYQFVSKENPSLDEAQGARALSDILDKKARELELQIKEHDVTKVHAYHLLDEICGLLRAVDELRNSHGKTAKFKMSALMAKVNDERRWLQFVEQLKLK
jgi:hypothetical protein